MSGESNEVGGMDVDEKFKLLSAKAVEGTHDTINESRIKSNDDFRKMMDEAEAGVFQSKKTFQPPAVSTTTLGTWEKHTKGIGMKLLNKFGFTGRLGAREDGVSRAIEVVVRPNGQGLGFGDFTESSALIVNKKLVAEWSGVEYKEVEVIETKKVKKIITEQIADSKSWKKGKKDKQSVKTVSVTDFLDKKTGDEIEKLVIIDMRGEQTRVLTDYSEMNTVPIEDENSIPKIGQELLYNINLVSDMIEIDITKETKNLANESKKVNIISNEINILENQMERDAPRLQRLENMMTILNRVNDRQKKELLMSKNNVHKRKFMNSSNNIDDDDHDNGNDNDNDNELSSQNTDSDITLSAIASLFKILHTNYKEEFHIFGIINLLPSVIYPVLVKLFDNWQPLSDPFRATEVHVAGTVLCDYFDEIGEHSLTAQTRLIVETTAQKVTLPCIRRVLTNDWNVHKPEKCVLLLETLKNIYPSSILDELMDMMIQPKLNLAVKTWLPSYFYDKNNRNNQNIMDYDLNDINDNNRNDNDNNINNNNCPIHYWLHPWLPLMKSKLSVYYPEIRRKLNIFINSNWKDIESVKILNMISPWKSIFDKISMDNFLIRTVIPKLLISLRNILINPQNQEIIIFENVLKWYSLIPHINFISLLRGEFFDRWLRVLINWLLLSPDFMEVSEWYSGWKSVFPESLLQDTDIMEPFNKALNLMNIALTSDEIESNKLLKEENTYFLETSYSIFLEKKMNDNKMRERLDELNKDERYTSNGSLNVSNAYGLGAPTGRSGEVTFKDVVESYAADNGITFIPKAGRNREGKQIWMFGKSLCYLDRDVVFVYISDQIWSAIGLEELLKMS